MLGENDEKCFLFTGLCHQDAQHITAILGESVVFNCHVEFPEQHPVPYVLQWEKKVGDTVRYRTSPSLLSIRELKKGAPFVKGTILVPVTAALPENIRNKLIPRTRPNESIDELLVRIAKAHYLRKPLESFDSQYFLNVIIAFIDLGSNSGDGV